MRSRQQRMPEVRHPLVIQRPARLLGIHREADLPEFRVTHDRSDEAPNGWPLTCGRAGRLPRHEQMKGSELPKPAAVKCSGVLGGALLGAAVGGSAEWFARFGSGDEAARPAWND